MGARCCFVGRRLRLWGPVPAARLPGVWREGRLRMDIGECSRRVGKDLCSLLDFLELFL